MKSFLKLASISLLASQCLGQVYQGQTQGQVAQDQMTQDQTVQGQTTQGQTTQGQTSSNSGTLASVYTECKKPGQFVLTFDDGPQIGTTLKCLDVLKQNGIIGTFFVNSANYVDLVNGAEARDIVKRAYDEGHDIGSHTFQHKDLFLAMDDGSLEINVDQNNEVIKSIIGRSPVFFRPPLGNGGFTQEYCAQYNIAYDPRTETVRQYLGERMKVIMWNADTQDWNSKGNVQNAINELSKSVAVAGRNPQTNSFITLLHDVHEYTVDVILQQVIDYVKQQGYQFVSLAECIGEAPYQDGYNPNQPSSPSGGNTNSMNSTISNSSLNQSLTGNKNIDLESSSIKSFVSSIALVLLFSLINALLY